MRASVTHSAMRASARRVMLLHGVVAWRERYAGVCQRHGSAAPLGMSATSTREPARRRHGPRVARYATPSAAGARRRQMAKKPFVHAPRRPGDRNIPCYARHQ